MEMAARTGGRWAVRLLWGALALIILANLVSRLALGVIVNDQAEMMVYSQDWRLVYDEQMPVYQWLINAALRGTGYFILTQDIVKYIFLLLTAVSLLVLGRRMTGGTIGGVLTVLLAFLVPTMNEDAMREYSHSIALLAAVAGSALFFVQPQWTRFDRWSPLLAAVWAGGLYAKHTMGIFILAEIAAFYLVFRPDAKEIRALAITFAVALLAVLPIYVMMVLDFATVEEGTAEFLGTNPLARLRGLGDLVSSLLAEGALLIVAGLAAWAFARKKHRPLIDPDAKFLLLVNAGMIALLFVGVLVTNASVVRDRWLSPGLILLAAPIAQWLVWGLSKKVRTILVAVLCAALVLIGFDRAWEPWSNFSAGKVDDENLPLREIAAIVSDKAAPGAVVIGPNQGVMGTVKLVRPDLKVYSPWTEENLPSGAATAWYVTTEKSTRKPLNFPGGGWSCAAPTVHEIPYRPKIQGTFHVEISQCRRVLPVSPRELPS